MRREAVVWRRSEANRLRNLGASEHAIFQSVYSVGDPQQIVKNRPWYRRLSAILGGDVAYLEHYCEAFEQLGVAGERDATLAIEQREALDAARIDALDRQLVERGGWRVSIAPPFTRRRIARAWFDAMEKTGNDREATLAAQECCSVLVWLAVGQLIVSILRLIWEATHKAGPPGAPKQPPFEAA